MIDNVEVINKGIFSSEILIMFSEDFVLQS